MNLTQQNMYKEVRDKIMLGVKDKLSEITQLYNCVHENISKFDALSEDSDYSEVLECMGALNAAIEEIAMVSDGIKHDTNIARTCIGAARRAVI